MKAGIWSAAAVLLGGVLSASAMAQPPWTNPQVRPWGNFWSNPWYGNSLPPGLAKRGGDLPPGLQKHLDRTGRLPPGLQKRYSAYPYGMGYYARPNQRWDRDRDRDWDRRNWREHPQHWKRANR